MSDPLFTYAVIFKTYAWDAFVCRQAERCAAVVGRGDFYISFDETRGPAARPDPCPNVIFTSSQRMLNMGLANRFERGSLLWWNADYAHYHFYREHPEYDYYIFVEYDAIVLLELESLIALVHARGIDAVTLPLREGVEDWCWTVPHLRVYQEEELRASLVCITIVSKRALDVLLERRLALAQAEALDFSPSAEAFIPTEINRAGLVNASLEEFGDVTLFDSSHPIHEDHATKARGSAFLHPVCDPRRFLARVRAARPDVWMLLDRSDITVRGLLRHHPFAFLCLLVTAGCLGSARSVKRWSRLRPQRR